MSLIKFLPPLAWRSHLPRSPLGGDGPFGLIDMGGMFTILKVRKQLTGDQDLGWYDHPAGTVAGEASAAELVRDGIKP